MLEIRTCWAPPIWRPIARVRWRGMIRKVSSLANALHNLARCAAEDFYGFEEDPDLVFADIHEDGRFLYPGTGAASETGKGPAEGTKLNVPLPPGAGDAEFDHVWPAVMEYLEAAEPEFVIMQCGADSLDGDPITHLRFSEAAHARAAAELRDLADTSTMVCRTASTAR